MGADAAQCANYTNSPTKSEQRLFPPYSDEVGLPIDRRDPSPSGPSPKGSPAQRKKNSSPGGKSRSKGKKKGGGGTNVPDTNALSPPSPKGQSPNVRKKSRPKSAPKRSPPADQLQHPIVVDEYTTPSDDYQLDDYSEEEIKLPDDAYDEDYEEDDEGQSSGSGGSISPARVIVNGKGEKDGKTLNASNARRHKGGKERRKKRKDDTKVTWHD